MASTSTSNFAEPNHEPFNVPIPSSSTKIFESTCATPSGRRKRKPPRSKTIAKLVAWQPKSFLPAESSVLTELSPSTSRIKPLGATAMPNINLNIFKSPKNKNKHVNAPTTEPDSSLLDTTTTDSSNTTSTPGSSRAIRTPPSKKNGGVMPASIPSRSHSPPPRSATWIPYTRSPNEKYKDVLQQESQDTKINYPSVQERVQTFFKRRNSVRAAVSDPLSCKRISYGEHAIRLKSKVLADNPRLSLLPAEEEMVGAGTDFLRCGMNTLRAELLDMNMMMTALYEHRLALSHSDIEVFFTWFTYFLEYFDRYMILEEDIIIRTIEGRCGRTRGEMQTSKRMKIRGRLLKSMHDLAECQHEFRRNLPAGEKLNVLADGVKLVTTLAVEYCEKFLGAFAPLLDENFSRTQIERLHFDAIRHILSRNGGVAEDADFIVMYTRWKTAGDLNRWKWKYLIRTARTLVPFKGWEEDVYDDHFKIAAEFADQLYEENSKQRMTVEENEWIETFRRAEIGMAKFNKSSTTDFPSPRAITMASFD